jgi:hypothetical protein
MTAARKEQAHRLERRHGDDPSQTPPFISLVARHVISQGTEEPPPQHPLQSAGPVLPINPGLPENQPRRGRPGPPPSDRVAAGDAMSAAGFVQQEKRILMSMP